MSRFTRFAGLALALFCLAVPPTQAQEQAKQAFSPMGDTSRFTRLGGWGGFGGMIGQYGLAKAMLVTNPAIHEELKVTAEQKTELKDWEAAMRKRGETMFRNGPGNPQQPQQQGGNEAGPGAQGAGPGGFNPFGMLDMITNLVQEGETSLAKILTKKQYTRLNQIALQMEGVAALGRDDVAEAIFLSPDQIETIRQIMTENKTKQIGFIMGQAFAMRGQRGQGQGRLQGQGQGEEARPGERPQSKAAPAQDEDPEAQAKRRAANRERMEGQFTKMRNGTDDIQNATTTKILKVLTKRQRERFDKLLGPPFDPKKFSFPGQPGRPQASADDAAVKKDAPTAPAPARPRLRDTRGVSTPDAEK